MHAEIPHDTEAESDLSARMNSLYPVDVLDNSPQAPAGMSF